MEVKQGEQSVRPENCLSSLQRMSFFWSTTRAAVLPIFFFSLDFFCRSFFLIIVSGMAPKALIWFFHGACPDGYRDVKTKERTTYFFLSPGIFSLPLPHTHESGILVS
jgi:hypothetical protein